MGVRVTRVCRSHRGSGTFLPLFAACLFFAAPEALAAGPSPAATPMPRLLLRNPIDVPPARREEVLSTVAGAAREAGALSIRASDFAKVVEARADVKAVMSGAREKVTQGIELDKQKQFADAVRSLEGAVEDFEFVGADVWLPDEVGKAYLALGLARWHRDVEASQKAPSKTTVGAWKRARELIPDFLPGAPDWNERDVATFKKAAGGAPNPPGPPGEGLFSLGRLLGLGGVIETRAGRKGELSLRVHKIAETTTSTARISSKTTGLDAAARAGLVKALGFRGPLPAVASASPAATPAAVAVAVTPTSTPAAATPTPKATPAAIAAAPTPTPNAAPTSTPEATATPVAAPTPSPVPSPTAVAAVTPRPNGGNAGRRPPPNGNRPNRGNSTVPAPAPTATPVAVDAAAPATMTGGPPPNFAGSYASLVGGADHRAALYVNETSYTSAPSGTSPAGWLGVWYVHEDVWAASLVAGGMQRAYLTRDDEDPAGAEQGTGLSQEISLHLLRSDDARGRWWIGGGILYVNEPRVTGPGAYPEVPSVSRITPSAMGVAQHPLGDRFLLRGRAIAGIAMDQGKSRIADDRSGLGYDVRVEAGAAFAMSRRLRFVGGGHVQRIFTDYGEQTTAVESRRGFWLGVEAGF